MCTTLVRTLLKTMAGRMNICIQSVHADVTIIWLELIVMLQRKLDEALEDKRKATSDVQTLKSQSQVCTRLFTDFGNAV